VKRSALGRGDDIGRRARPFRLGNFDLAFGAALPILVLNNLTSRLGAPPAYVLAALIPVTWVVIDLLLRTGVARPASPSSTLA